MASAQYSPASSPGSLSPSLSDRRSPSPITPISEDGLAAQQAVPLCRETLTPSPDISHAHSWHGNHPEPSLSAGGRRLSTVSTVSAPMERRKPHSSVGVGKMILDILPGKLDVSSQKVARPAARPCIAQPRPIVASIPTVQLPATPPQLDAPSFPRVVVVVPTPRPTPPATPGVSHPRTLAGATLASTMLLPPQPARSLTSATIASTPTSTQSAVPPSAASHPQPAAAAASSGLSKRGSPGAVSTAPTASKSKTYNDETLKASDRRFFLQDSGSPDVDSPERPPSNGSNVSEAKAQSPSSGTSSHIKSEVTGPTAAKRPRVQVRKSKERHVPTRPALQRLHSHGLRQTSQKKAPAAEPKKAAFNIGSLSSNGSRAGPSTKGTSQNGDAPSRTRPPSPTAPAKQAAPPQKASANGAGPSQQRRGIVISTSSEYETDSDDDSDWASEGDSTEEREKAKKAETAEEKRIREAVEEAQRQRDMFAKVPKRSYSNLNRTRSGLLSQLLNPDPNIFPPNHPYRSSRSTQDMTQLGRSGPTPMLQMSKSSVAVPLAAQVQVTAPAPPSAVDNTRPGGYRLKGRPQEEELEDTESDDDNPDDTIQVSRSLAQQKLAALANPNRRRPTDRGLLSQQKEQQQHFHHQQMQEAGPRPGLTTIASAPIPLNHPYNLPAPAPPMTPRTTRRQMLQTELSESLRRNLLWERQVSRVNMTGRRGGGVLGSGIRPLTAMNGDGPVAAQQQQQVAAPSAGQGRPQGQGPQGNSDDREERRRRAMARNRSWADDYHYSGW
ncbi:hypothetical protein C8Q79DRAFT_520834 [Trametes meyenii]|nr:hypothetical protein C8Q79DRAFT_520834 [Trametes meyenii]